MGRPVQPQPSSGFSRQLGHRNARPRKEDDRSRPGSLSMAGGEARAERKEHEEAIRR